MQWVKVAFTWKYDIIDYCLSVTSKLSASYSRAK